MEQFPQVFYKHKKDHRTQQIEVVCEFFVTDKGYATAEDMKKAMKGDVHDCYDLDEYVKAKNISEISEPIWNVVRRMKE